MCIAILCFLGCGVINFEIAYPPNQAVFLHDQNVRAKISWKQKELLRWNKKHFQSFKGLSVAKNWPESAGGGGRSQPISHGTPPEITSNKTQDKTSLNTHLWIKGFCCVLHIVMLISNRHASKERYLIHTLRESLYSVWMRTRNNSVSGHFPSSDTFLILHVTHK